MNGNDTANKLYIVARTIGIPVVSHRDIPLTGISEVTSEDLLLAQSRGNTIKLVATAELGSDRQWSLRVSPEEIPADSFLGGCNGWEMGVELESDYYEKVCMKNYEADPLGTSAAVLRDILSIAGD